MHQGHRWVLCLIVVGEQRSKALTYEFGYVTACCRSQRVMLIQMVHTYERVRLFLLSSFFLLLLQETVN